MTHINKISADILPKFVDHTLLKPDASEVAIKKLCDEALKYNFATVCVNPMYVLQISELLTDTTVNPCTVVGFPLGANLPVIKIEETKRAISDGAMEVDMVMNIGAFKNRNLDYVRKDLLGVVEACKAHDVISKVIIETAVLSPEEKIEACKLVADVGADFVKTSTGFASGGATVEDVKLMKVAVKGSNVKVKASGGIRSYQDAMNMIKAGASRIGTSSGIAIMREAISQFK